MMGLNARGLEHDVSESVPIEEYREFYDFPRMFVVRWKGQRYLFDGSFDDSIDDYPPRFDVYVVTLSFAEPLPHSWQSLTTASARRVGTISTADVKFDASGRRSIDSAAFDLLSASSIR
jgi:hypothetical protein